MIRVFQPSDAVRLRDVFLASINSLEDSAYSVSQLRAWSARAPTPDTFQRRVADGQTILVSLDTTALPVAFIVLEAHDHIDLLYCHPDHMNRGHARALIFQAEIIARQAGKSEVFVEASEIARPVFERAGYVMDHRRDFKIDGVPIHNYRMIKTLPSGSA